MSAFEKAESSPAAPAMKPKGENESSPYPVCLHRAVWQANNNQASFGKSGAEMASQQQSDLQKG